MDTYTQLVIENDLELFNDIPIHSSKFMPIYQFKFSEQINTQKYDIFLNDSDKNFNGDVWDYNIPIDYDKLKKYIQV